MQPAILCPVAEMTALCRAAGVPSLVDGAHAPGQLAWTEQVPASELGAAAADASPSPLRLDGLGCDLYIANLHKWCLAPRPAGLLYVAAADPAAASHSAPGSRRSGGLDVTRLNPSIWAAERVRLGAAAETVGTLHDRLCQGIYDGAAMTAIASVVAAIAQWRLQHPMDTK